MPEGKKIYNVMKKIMAMKVCDKFWIDDLNIGVNKNIMNKVEINHISPKGFSGGKNRMLITSEKGLLIGLFINGLTDIFNNKVKKLKKK